MELLKDSDLSRITFRFMGLSASGPVIVILVVVCLIHLIIYFAFGGAPINSGSSGWEGWWDQSQYLKSTRAFAEFNFAADQHWYPIGYALLAAPFALILDDPFLPINLISIVAFAWLFVRYFEPYIGVWISGLIFILALMFPLHVEIPNPVAVILWLQFVIPWNTVPVAPLFMAILTVMRSLQDDDVHVRHDLLLGALAGGVVAIRAFEILPLLAIGIFYSYLRLIRAQKLRHVAAAIGGAAIVAAPVYLLNTAIHGGFKSAYSQNISVIGFSVDDLPQRMFNMLIDAGQTYNEPNTAFFAFAPWLILALPLAIVGALARLRDFGPPVALAMAAFMAYCSFNDFWPENILRYWLIHYVAWAFPVVIAVAACSGLWLRRQSRWTVVAGVALVATVAFGSLRAVPTVVPLGGLHLVVRPEGVEALLSFDRPVHLDALDLPRGTPVPRRGQGGNPMGITVNGEPLEVFSGYRVLNLPDRLRIVFNQPVMAKDVSAQILNRANGERAVTDPIHPLRFQMRWAMYPFAPRSRPAPLQETPSL